MPTAELLGRKSWMRLGICRCRQPFEPFVIRMSNGEVHEVL